MANYNRNINTGFLVEDDANTYQDNQGGFNNFNNNMNNNNNYYYQQNYSGQNYGYDNNYYGYDNNGSQNYSGAMNGDVRILITVRYSDLTCLYCV